MRVHELCCVPYLFPVFSFCKVSESLLLHVTGTRL